MVRDVQSALRWVDPIQTSMIPKPQRPKLAAKAKPKAALPKKAAPQRTGQGPSLGAAIAVSQKQTSREPLILQRGSRETVICHRELVSSVNGSIAFTATKFPLNPGVATTFPWLSTQANLWDQYRFRRLRFEYITRTATTTVGSVLLVPDYDPTDIAPTSEAIASAHSDTVEDACYKNLTCVLDPRAMNPFGGTLAGRRYVRSFNQAGDISTFDSGNFYFCTVEQTGASAIGKLWVEYEVELFKPQLGNTTVAPSLTSLFALTPSQALVTGVSTNLIPNAQVADPLSVGLVGTPLVSGTFTPPKGSYLISGYVQFADTVNEAFTCTAQVRQNGAALAQPSICSISIGATGAANESLTLPIAAVVNCSGTDTIDVRVTAVGAAGVLTVNTAQLIFRLA